MLGVANAAREIVLSVQELREVTSYAAESAQEVLECFERAHPGDSRPPDAIEAAWTFARGGKRGRRCAMPLGRRAGVPTRSRHGRGRGDASSDVRCRGGASSDHRCRRLTALSRRR
jgi:hypothetical protein